MTLASHISDREFDKFEELNGETVVRVIQKLANGARVVGQSTGGRITEVTLNDTTWTPLPATALDPRNAVGIQNTSAINVKTNWDNTVVGFVGMLVRPNNERYYEIAETIVVYGKCETGSITVNVEELG
jgi:hypothetical protein